MTHCQAWAVTHSGAGGGAWRGSRGKGGALKAGGHLSLDVVKEKHSPVI